MESHASHVQPAGNKSLLANLNNINEPKGGRERKGEKNNHAAAFVCIHANIA